MSADGASGHLIEAKEVPRPDAQRGYIEIFEQLCKGCDLCIPACPVRIIEPGRGSNMMGWRPVVVEADLMKYCIGCYEIQHKLERMRAEETRWDSYRCDDAEFVVVAYGIMARIAKEAVKQAREEGIKVGLFRPITLFPFPEAPLGELASRAREVLTVEINFGQVLTDVRLAVAGRCPVQFFGQPALAIPARAVLEAIRQMAAGQPVEPRGFHDVHPTAFHLADTHPPARKQMLDQLAARRGQEGAQAMLDNLLGIRKNTVIPEVGRD